MTCNPNYLTENWPNNNSLSNIGLYCQEMFLLKYFPICQSLIYIVVHKFADHGKWLPIQIFYGVE